MTRNSKPTRLLRLLAVALLAGLALAGCGDDATTPPTGSGSDQAPALPPAASMQFDFGFFDAHGGAQGMQGKQGKQGADASSESETAHLNWINAVVRVTYINLVVADAFGPAVEAFEAAIQTDPVIQSDGTFLWTYTWNDGEHEVVIELGGRFEGDHIAWELRVTSDEEDPPLERFLWFHGESSLVEDSGFWIFNDRQASGDPIEVARIDWNVEDENHRLLSFEDIDQRSDDLGDTLTYRVDATVVTIEFYDASEDITADITWDELTGAGSLQVPDYNNGERACWDEEQLDVECPADRDGV